MCSEHNGFSQLANDNRFAFRTTRTKSLERNRIFVHNIDNKFQFGPRLSSPHPILIFPAGTYAHNTYRCEGKVPHHHFD